MLIFVSTLTSSEILFEETENTKIIDENKLYNFLLLFLKVIA